MSARLVILVALAAGCGGQSGADTSADAPRVTTEAAAAPQSSTRSESPQPTTTVSSARCRQPKSALATKEQVACTAAGFEVTEEGSVPTGMSIITARDGETFLTLVTGGANANCRRAANGDFVCAYDDVDGIKSVICLEANQFYYADEVFGYMYQSVNGGAVFNKRWCSQ